MDIRSYFRKLREIEGALPESGVVVVSLQTADGGRAGRVMELDRSLAARMLADQRVRTATEDEEKEFRFAAEADLAEYQGRHVVPKVQFMADLIAVKRPSRRKEDGSGEE